MPERHGGPIDPHSPYSLYDFVEGGLPDPSRSTPVSLEWFGFHVTHTGGGQCHVIMNGRVDAVHSFTPDDYDDVLELVADLVDILIQAQDYRYRDDMEGLAKWAGRKITEDRAQYAQDTDFYSYQDPGESNRGLFGHAMRAVEDSPDEASAIVRGDEDGEMNFLVGRVMQMASGKVDPTIASDAVYQASRWMCEHDEGARDELVRLHEEAEINPTPRSPSDESEEVEEDVE